MWSSFHLGKEPDRTFRGTSRRSRGASGEAPAWKRSVSSNEALRSRKKRVSIFDERSHYVIENKDSGLRTKPNKPNFSHSSLGENWMRQAGAPVG